MCVTGTHTTCSRFTAGCCQAGHKFNHRPHFYFIFYFSTSSKTSLPSFPPKNGGESGGGSQLLSSLGVLLFPRTSSRGGNCLNLTVGHKAVTIFFFVAVHSANLMQDPTRLPPSRRTANRKGRLIFTHRRSVMFSNGVSVHKE